MLEFSYEDREILTHYLPTFQIWNIRYPLNYVECTWYTQYNCRFSDKKMSFPPNVPELDITISQQIVVRSRKKLLQWYAKELLWMQELKNTSIPS